MDATKELREAERAETAAPDAARARARAYLDLWERQLVHAALHGRPPPGPGSRRLGTRPPTRDG